MVRHSISIKKNVAKEFDQMVVHVVRWLMKFRRNILGRLSSFDLLNVVEDRTKTHMINFKT